MTSSPIERSAPSRDDVIRVEYEGPSPTPLFGGYPSADFIVARQHHASLEYNLGLALDAQLLLQEKAQRPLSAEDFQAVLRALAGPIYARLAAAQTEIPPIVLLRARDLRPMEVDAALAEAGLA